jgi:hypothetical protein
MKPSGSVRLMVSELTRILRNTVLIPCALLPGLLVPIFGKRQRDLALEELAR